MVNRALIRTLENDPDIESMFEQEIANFEESGLFPESGSIGADFEVNKIVEGRILRVEDGNVMVDIGFKSEASVPMD
jgi:small subunit ribosomal protein S1